MTTTSPHLPVMLSEVVAAAAPLEGATVVDMTFGAGGYSRAFWRPAHASSPSTATPPPRAMRRTSAPAGPTALS